MFDPKLLELPLSAKAIRSSAIVLCVDLSRPAQLIFTTTLWLNNISKLISKRLGKDSPSLNNVFKGHQDAKIVKPLELPCYIFANKFDAYKSMQQADKRLILQILRFVAHYYGASLIATSAVEPSMKEGFRNVLSAINFRTGLRTACDPSFDKPFYISAGQDSFASILLGSERDMGGGKVSQLATLC
jgi:dynein light intermediate chain 2, cytosolic